MTNPPDATSGLQAAIAKAGGKAKLAALAGINRSTLSNWLKRGRGVPAGGIHMVAKATGMPPHEIRPDLYPAPVEIPPSVPADPEIDAEGHVCRDTIAEISRYDPNP